MIVYQTDARFGWCNICKAEEVHHLHEYENEYTETCVRCKTVTDCNSIQYAINVCHGKELFKESNDRTREMLKVLRSNTYDEDKEDWDIQNKHS